MASTGYNVSFLSKEFFPPIYIVCEIQRVFTRGVDVWPRTQPIPPLRPVRRSCGQSGACSSHSRQSSINTSTAFSMS